MAVIFFSIPIIPTPYGMLYRHYATAQFVPIAHITVVGIIS